MTLKLVALDIDGTLVGPDLELGAEAVEAVARLQAAGVEVTLATGRMLRSTLGYARQLEIGGPVICYQGGLTADVASGRYLRHEGRSPQIAYRALERLAGFSESGGQVLAYVDDEIYSTTRTAWSNTYERRMGVEIYLIDTFGEVAERDPTLILAVDTSGRGDTTEIMGDLVGRLRAEMGGDALITHSLPHFCEIGSARAGKRQALEHLAGVLGIRRRDVAAFGDGSGDASMLGWAGVGAAMAGGHPDALAAADVVVEGPPGAGVAAYLTDLLDRGEFG